MNEYKKRFFIDGDINLNLFNRGQCTCDYLDCISSAGALQFVDLPTRHSADYLSSSLIDHVYSSFDCEKLNVNVVDYDISDHMPVICEIKCEKSKNEYCDLRSFQDFSKFEVGAFLNDLSVKLRGMNLCAENCEDVNKCWDEFESIFSGTVFDHAPVKILSKKEP